MAGLQGRAFGGYKLTEQLRGGVIADVYRAHPVSSGGRDVAVKVIYPEFARQPGFLSHFRQIVQMSARLASHPHILPLIASGEENGYLYMVTPYVGGGTLRDWIQQGGRMGIADAGPFFRQLSDALGYAHSLGVMHGNVKPSNIFLFEGRHVLLGDFGLLWDLSHMDMEHAGSGTEAVEYLAPEVLSGQVTQQSDIYSLGGVLFASVAGQPPFQGAKPAEIFSGRLMASLAQAQPGLAPAILALDPVIQRAMARQPEARFPSAMAVVQAIEAIAQQAALQPQAAPSPAPQLASQLPVAPVAPAPFAGSSAQAAHHPFAAPAAPMPFAPSAPPVAPLAAGLGAAATAAAGAAGSSLGQLNPPFPPLPPTATVDEHMEQGRQGRQNDETGAQSTVRMPAPNGTNTLGNRLVKPVLPRSPSLPQEPFTGSSLPPTPHAANAQPVSPQRFFDDFDDRDEAGPQMLPAVRGMGASPSAPAQRPAANVAANDNPSWGNDKALSSNFNNDWQLDSDPRRDSSSGRSGGMIAPPADMTHDPYAESVAGLGYGYGTSGNRDEWQQSDDSYLGPAYNSENGADRADESRWGQQENSRDQADEFGASSAWAGGYTGEFTGEYTGQHTDLRTAVQGREYSDELTGEYTGEYTGVEAAVGSDGIAQDGDMRPFSPTQLGLPRLTNPALNGMPPSWQEIVADAPDEPWGAQPNEISGPQMPWRSNPSSSGREWTMNGGSQWEPQPAAARGIWDAPKMGAASPSIPNVAGERWQPAQKTGAADPSSLFDGDRVWTNGSNALKKHHRWRSPLAVLIVLILVVGALIVVVVRPDLCPISGCRTISNKVHQAAPFLPGASTAVPNPLTISPSMLSISTSSGKSATATVTVKNSGSDTVAWKVTTQGQSWLSVNPASGTLSQAGSTPLTVTAAPTKVAPGTYAGALVITTDQGATTIPISIVVH